MPDPATNPAAPPATTQRARWIKYGANVVLSCVVVVLLAGLLIYLGETGKRRFDMTRGGTFSLKPQTLNVIRNLKSPIKLVSLYSHKTNDPELQAAQSDRCQAVEDLLNEYKTNGRNIEVDFVDPLSNLSKKDALIAEVSQKYGGEVKRYRAFLDSYGAQYDKIKALSDAESKLVAELPLNDVKSNDLQVTLATIIDTVRSFPPQLDEQKDAIDRTLKQKLPDYRGAVSEISDAMEQLSARLAAIEDKLAKTKDSPDVPPAIKTYFDGALPRYDQLKKLADGLVGSAKNLGELKLDSLRQSLRDDSILVLGDDDLRVIGSDQVWSLDPRAVKQAANETGSGEQLKPSFAGEQMLTTAIFALTQPKKQRIVFVRPGGGPLTDPGLLGLAQAGGGPFSEIAQRLQSYNFDVQEKDLSGQYAMQAQMRGMPVPPEPTDAELADAIWVVLAFPTSQQPDQGPPPVTGARLADHLKAGGSALVFPFLKESSISEPLHQWGIDVATDAVAVHVSPPESDVQGGNQLDRLRRVPYIFDIRDYGDHPITRPLRSLASLLFPILPVTVASTPPQGITVTPIIPVPTAPQSLLSFGKRNLDDPNADAKYDPSTDIPAPFFAGAAAEKQGAGRLVVLSCGEEGQNDMLDYQDPEMAQRRLVVPAFPANAELFCNSIFWLAHLEPMLAISPAAMEVSRVADMSNATQWMWRFVVLGGLPLLVLVAGMSVYFARRD